MSIAGKRMAILGLAEWFGLYPIAAAQLLALYEAPKGLPAAILRRQTGGTSVEAVKVHVSQIRKALDGGNIERWADHYRLTPDGRKEVHTALTQMLGEARAYLTPIVERAA